MRRTGRSFGSLTERDPLLALASGLPPRYSKADGGATSARFRYEYGDGVDDTSETQPRRGAFGTHHTDARETTALRYRQRTVAPVRLGLFPPVRRLILPGRMRGARLKTGDTVSHGIDRFALRTGGCCRSSSGRRTATGQCQRTGLGPGLFAPDFSACGFLRRQQISRGLLKDQRMVRS